MEDLRLNAAVKSCKSLMDMVILVVLSFGFCRSGSLGGISSFTSLFAMLAAVLSKLLALWVLLAALELSNQIMKMINLVVLGSGFCRKSLAKRSRSVSVSYTSFIALIADCWSGHFIMEK
jgi:hypothetical protein